MVKKSTTITLQLPDEFIDLCESDQVSPEGILRGFIADLCEIHSWADNPRKDGYSSSGSDERLLARQYYERCGWPYLKSNS